MALHARCGCHGHLVILFAGVLLFGAAGTGETLAQARALVAPPRSIADITAILDQEKPEPAKRAKAEAEASAEPGNAKGQQLSEFLYRRCQARAALGRVREAITDCEQAIALGGDYANHVSRIEQ